jgi:HD-like signal output (HDOD) protein
VSILQSLHDIQEIPSLPVIVLQIRRLVESDSSDAKALSDIIEHDPALASKILHVANSVYFTPANQRISSLQNAVIRLGYDTVRSIAMAIGLIKQFSPDSSVLNHTTFWRHSVAAAYLAREVAANATGPHVVDLKDAPFTCGLLHDIGIIIYEQFLHEKFLEVVYHGRAHGLSFLAAEREISEKENHAMVGGVLLEMWKLESSVVSAVRYHHAPHKAPESHRFLASVVSLTEHILCNSRIGSIEGPIEGEMEETLQYLGIEPGLSQTLLVAAEERIARHSATVAHVAVNRRGT